MISIYGLYFRDWLVSAAAGFALALLFTRAVGLTPARGVFSSPLFLPALTVIFGFLFWSGFFTG
ncbi:MAG: hypothetical protein WC889_11705 [Myxococcota bacterium]|jgi:hypothetical protein